MNSDSEIFIRMYDDGGNLAYSWFMRAKYLLVSSDILRNYSDQLMPSFEDLYKRNATIPDEAQTGGVSQMLRGMAIESLLKGLWVDNGGIIAKDGRYNKIINGSEHNLVGLSEKVTNLINLDLSKDELFLLERLSIYIYHGRYPILKKWEVLKPKELPRGGFGPLNTWSIPQDDILFDYLVLKLKSKFKGKYE